MNETMNENGISATSGKYDSVLAYVGAANDHYKAEIESMTSADQMNPESLGFRLSRMLISCYFRGQNCSIQDFYYYHDFYYGSCYRFNGGPKDKAQNGIQKHAPSEINKVSKSGWRNGLRLELYAGKGVFYYKKKITNN